MAYGRYLEPEIETMSRPDLTRLQEERLLGIIPAAYENAPLIRAKWDAARVKPSDIRSIDDYFERVPFITKDDIRAFRDEHGDPFGGMRGVPRDQVTDIHSTSGTTGDATLLPEQRDTWGWMAGDYARPLWEMGLRPGDGVVMAGTQIRGRLEEIAQRMGAYTLFADHLASELDLVLEYARRYQPKVFYPCSIVFLVALAQAADRIDVKDAMSCFSGVVFAAEPLGSKMRTLVDSWGLPLYIQTSAGDAGTSFECSAHDGCHIWEDAVLPEHLEQGGNVAMADGEVGELVVTALTNPAMPLLRFRSDDLVRFTRQKCTCGRTHARQWPVGRRSDETIVQGKSIFTLDVWSAIESVYETEGGIFQIIRPQREVDELRLRIGFSETRTVSLTDLEDRLIETVANRCGVAPRIELIADTELLKQGPAYKIPRVVKS